MAQLQIIHLLHPGTQERYRQIYEEIAGPRKEQFEAACQQMNIIQIQVRFTQMLNGDLMLVTLDVNGEEPRQALQELLSSEQVFSSWLRDQISTLSGWNMQKILSDPYTDQVLDFNSNNGCTKCNRQF